ncbi:MAG: hypothetical protein ACREXW_13615 [Gammaproteobacteria bacterium]
MEVLVAELDPARATVGRLLNLGWRWRPLLRWAQPRFGNSARLDAVRKLVYLRLMEKYQEFNPFKFILYSAEIEEFTPQVKAPLVATTSMPEQ